MDNLDNKTNKTNNLKNLKDLKTIEHELESCFNTDRKNWIKIYKLMTEVQDEELFKQDKLKSFTAWVNKLAADIGCHVSLLWSRLKAGRTYEEYYNRQTSLGNKAKPLEEISVSPDSINLASTVAGRNANEMDNLIDKVICGNLTRDDLRQAAKIKKSFNKKNFNKSESKQPATRHNRIDANSRKTDLKEPLKASDIVLALNNESWLKSLNLPEFNDNKPYKNYVYKTFTEFRANVGITKAVRKIDLLAIENYTTIEAADNVVIHGIEIKVDINDLKNDHKMGEYTDFVDYFYIAIPNISEMIELAQSLKLDSWGVLVIDSINNNNNNKTVNVLRPAKKLTPIFREKTLSNIILRSL